MKILWKLAVAVMVVLILWVGISFFDVILHNNSEDPVYQDWNFFSRVLDATEDK